MRKRLAAQPCKPARAFLLQDTGRHLKMGWRPVGCDIKASPGLSQCDCT